MGERIGLRQVRALQPGQTIWDASVAGFQARRQTERDCQLHRVLSHSEGRQRWLTIGRHGSPWTPDTARVEARRPRAVASGADPAADKKAKRNARTVAELCDSYLADAKAGRFLTRRKVPKKASTLAIDIGRIKRHIKPLMGRQRSQQSPAKTSTHSFMTSRAARLPAEPRPGRTRLGEGPRG